MPGIYNLPEEIVFDIFDRLPTKFLLRLRCLSNHWNHSISDHFNKSRSRQMIFLPFTLVRAIDNTLPDNFNVHTTFDLPSTLNPPLPNKDHVIVAGSYNGIVLLFLKNFILYNPFTRAFKIVPDPPYKSCLSCPQNYGFGYGTTPEDLKIVRLRCNGTDDSRSCDVFTLKKGSWSTKSLRLDEYSIRQYAGTFVNGFLYWMVTRKRASLIVALDITEMVISEIQLPFTHCPLDCLGTSDGHLQIFHVMERATKFELWVMNEDGIEKSWSNVLTSNSDLGFCFPLSIIDVGKIVLLKNNKQVIIHDMLKGSYEAYEVKGIEPTIKWKLQAMEYVESLISPSHLCSYLI